MRGGMSPLTDAFNGDVVNHDVNMTNREFNCAQPTWDPFEWSLKRGCLKR